jgi:hypothetical protein
LRNVECDYAAGWKSLEQIGGKSAGAAASVKNQFVASEFETGEDLFSPTNLRLRKTVVFGRIPFADVA